MWQKTKTVVTTLVIGAIAGILIFLKFKEGEDSADALEDAKLQGQEAIVDQDIKSIEDDLDGIGIEEASPEDVIDFWENLWCLHLFLLV